MRWMGLFLAVTLFSGWQDSEGREYHVSLKGDDADPGTTAAPFRTIQHAADLAQPGDTITVHEGIYRERIDPPRGGTSDDCRIIYRTAPGEKVEIRGSEEVRNWKKVDKGIWETTLPNDFFGDFNPFADLIRGDWFNRKGRDHHTGAVYLDGHWLTESASLEGVLSGKSPLHWHAEAGEEETVIRADFGDADPNERQVEVNVRQAIFYPSKPGRNYITVRGFTMRHAAPNWAPPTAEQMGLIGTHWSKGWVIENNVISHSVCTGVTLGKYGDEFDNKAQSAVGYVGTINRALENGWSRENIGHHVVRNNHISHCEQAGLVGSLGAVFSTITGNTIHDIHVRCLFSGAEMAGIKIHASIDMEISGNRVYRTWRGIWLDWMAQGARVKGNLLHDNKNEDLFVEVNHGPFLIENNLFLSPSKSLLNLSEGGAYVHNLMAGPVDCRPISKRETPYHPPHVTTVAGLKNIKCGDDRFINNIFIGGKGLSYYDKAHYPVMMEGNVFLGKPVPCSHEKDPAVHPGGNPDVGLVEKDGVVMLEMTWDPSWAGGKKRRQATTEMLGKAVVPDLPFENPDGTPLRVDRDFLGRPMDGENPFPGPFAGLREGRNSIRVWPGGN